MTRVSRNVNTIGELIFDSYIAVDSEPVLQRQDGPHSGAVHMLVDDELSDLRSHLLRSISPPTHLLVVEALGNGAIFFPPSAQRVHIVRSGRADALIRRVGRVGELNRRIFRHSLDLEAEDLQLVHDVRNASRYHAEVLTAAEHMGRMDQRRQLAHRRVTPELGMTTEEIIIVDTHEYLFLVAIELVERVALVD